MTLDVIFNHVVSRFPPFDVLQCREDVIFDFLDNVCGKHHVVEKNLFESAHRVIRQRVNAELVDIVRKG